MLMIIRSLIKFKHKQKLLLSNSGQCT